MIVDDLANIILRKQQRIFQQTQRRDVRLLIYMPMDLWRRMVSQLNGRLSNAGYDVVQSHGRSIMGHKIYRVLPSGANEEEDGSMRIFEDKEGLI